MADERSLRFAAILAGALGVIVATAAAALAPRIAHNAELERRRHVLAAAGIVATPANADELYHRNITEESVRLDGIERAVYRATAGGATTAHIVPVEGSGLWGPIRGYLALDATATWIRGVTFYAHRETPGLGAQIDEPRWTARWVGKSIRGADGALVGIRVERGARADDPNAVDAISGATITSRAVEQLVRKSLETYRPYLEEQWPR